MLNQQSAKNVGEHCANWKFLYPATDRHPEPDESSQCIRFPLLYLIWFFLSFLLSVYLPNGVFSSDIFFSKFIYVPLTYILDALSQLTAKFYLCFLSLFGDSLTIQLLYRSIQFCRHFLSFTFRYFSCKIYFKHTHSNLLPQCQIQTSHSYKKRLILQQAQVRNRCASDLLKSLFGWEVHIAGV